MDTFASDIIKFEQALQNRNIKQKVLYDNPRTSSCGYKVEDVICGVAKQINAIQKADAKNTFKRLKGTDITTQNELVPLNVLMNKISKQDIQNKFETQCVTDTQLIDIVENAETLAAQSGITQEFETTFCQKLYTNINKLDTGQNNAQCNNEEINDAEESKDNFDLYVEIIKQSKHIKSNKRAHDSCESSLIEDIEIFELEDDSPKSPILNKIKPIVLRNTPGPSIVCRLESFEKFEAIAVPIIEEQPNLQIAKKIINSQIVNRELCIDSHKNPILTKRDRSKSPVFQVKSEKRNSYTKIPIKVTEQNVDSKSSPTIIEDEILFSSDEENNIPEKNVEDLPLTCALETSFYNRTGVLDETMYVGFQTASNKSIQIHTDSFVKAKNVLYVSEMDLKDLVNAFDSSDIFNQNSNLVPKITINNEEPKMSDKDVSFQNCLSNVQFKTANDKSIQDEDIVMEMDHSEGVTDLELICYSKKTTFDERNLINPKKEKNTNDSHPKTNNLNSKIDENITEDLIKINDDIILQEFENSLLEDDNKHNNNLSDIEVLFKHNENALLNNNFEGFKTASSKPIKISDQALLRSRKIFESIENEVATNFETKLNQNESTTVTKENDEDNLSKTKNYITKNASSLTGFQTASNKKIKISEKALQKGKKLFEDINEDVTKVLCGRSKTTETNELIKHENYLNSKYEAENTNFEGFKTANNKPINVSSKTLTKFKNIFHDILEEKADTVTQNTNNDHQSKKFDYIEATTSNNLSRNTNLRFNQHSDLKKKLNSCFQTANQKSVGISEESFISSEQFLNRIDQTSEFNREKDKVPLIGFQTASHKHINISKDALARSKRIFDDIEEAAENDININARKFSNKYDANLTIKSNYENVPKEIYQRFQTASNKKIAISEKSLAKYRTLFDDIDTEMANNVQDTRKRSSEIKDNYARESKLTLSFQTASNKQINISKDALAKSKRIFDDIDENTDNDINLNARKIAKSISENPKETFQGFKTASNKKISISEKSLAKYKALFDDIDIDNIQTVSKSSFNLNKNNAKESKLKFTFQTANNDPVDITEEALAASQALLNIDRVEKEISDKFKGFQTASNKPVKISKEALARTKNIFNDMDSNLDISEVMPMKISSTAMFQTASLKPVSVSEEAILASQKLFENDMITKEITFGSSLSKFQGFQTASKKEVKISKQSLAKTMKVFEGIDLQSDCNDIKNIDHSGVNIEHEIKPSTSGFKTPNKLKNKETFNTPSNNYNNTKEKNNVTTETNDVDIKDILDTQVMDNFEDTLYTEDFLKDRTPIQCKRSGSPILSCPKAKKRKFQAPASTAKKKISAKIEICQMKNDNSFVFDENYKKHRKYTLKDLDKINGVNNSTVDNYVYNFNYENMLEFIFKGYRNEVTNDSWTTDKIKEFFLESVNAKIVPTGWIENHLKLIIWKLISYEIRFPFMQTVCTVKNVLEQLKYRYDRELYNVQRPALRKILEKDDVASKTMVLCVAGLYVDGVHVSSVANLTDTVELLLTDGWYCIKASIDKFISKLVYDGRITVGTKILTHGAELLNCEQGVAPWEDTSSVRLKISGNSTRRARWDARLGYYGNAAILSQLSSVKPDGGKVSKLRVFVTRVYPTLYIEKFEDGSTVTRSERLENLYQMKYESDRQLILEKIYEDVEKEFSDLDSQDSEGLDVDCKKLESGSQIAKLMKKHRDPAEFRASLTESQLHLLQEYTSRRKDKQIEQMQQKARERIKNSSLSVARSVVPLMKVRVASVDGKDCKISKGMLSIWRPNEAIQEVIIENTWIDVYNVVPTAIRNSEIQLSASRLSIFQRCKTKSDKHNSYTDCLKRQCYLIQDIARNPKMSTEYNEIDTAGFIISIEPSNKDLETSKQLYQNMYLADENKNIICINFWGGIKKFGFENILDTGQVIACVNLQKRSGNTMKNIPQYRATEFSYFTKTPKYDGLRKLAVDLIKVFSGLDKRKFCLDCVAIKNNYLNPKHCFPDISPYRLNNSDYNISKNKNFIDSPVNKDSILNLSGLDFESTFRQTETQDISPNKLLRKKKVDEKIAKLKFYGEPPPLSPMNLIHKSKNVASAFKSPLTSRNEDLNVASNGVSIPITEAIDKENSNLECSPVLSMTRNYVKRISVNPVKLNFNNEVCDKEVNTEDPFAEEFDASPPLSLD